MAEVTSELIYEVLKSIQSRTDSIDGRLADIDSQLIAMRGHLNAVQHDVGNLYTKAAETEARLRRIERRLDIIDEPAQ